MKNLPGLDLIRAFAIIWVMSFHALKSHIGFPVREFAHFGWMGVDLFFVLSGFLIGRQLFRSLIKHNALDFKTFYLRRAFRILPAYLVVVLLYFTVPVFREKEAIQPLWQFFTFTENLFINVHGGKAFSHVWSLCVEEYFYLLFPVIAWVMVRKRSAKSIIVVVLCVLLAGMMLRGFLWQHALEPIQHIKKGEGNFRQIYFQLIYYPTYSRLDGLLAGVSLAVIYSFRPKIWQYLMSKANAVLLLGIACFSLSVLLFQDRLSFITTIIGYPLLSISLAMFVAAAASSTGVLGRVRIPGAATIAVLSYSLYLTHKAIFHMVEQIFGQFLNQHSVVAFLVYGLSAVGFASILYLSIERPFLGLRNHISDTMQRRAKPVMENS